eukprot:TRINITY_DN1433_c0_g1_i3.p1 TRINITY_DN1433_c0_g1~~TRINITY_DN1433_c0_g1_i3.p1  ORF type:complete len:333 (-),score=59.79 TRINITY_DN1433_c0_g1_i3:173-1171(-)
MTVASLLKIPISAFEQGFSFRKVTRFTAVRRIRVKNGLAFIFLASLVAHMLVGRSLLKDSRINGLAGFGTYPSRLIAAENELPGTDEWQLRNPAMVQEIEGYASATSVDRGETILLYVSAQIDKQYIMRFFRMGWYGGLGGREVRPPVARPGFAQKGASAPLHFDDPGFVDCAWQDPYTLEVPDSWTTGYYLVQLTGSESGKQSYIIFVVRDDEATTDFLMSSAVSTWNAYNNWGGRSSYPYNSVQSGCCAQQLSFNRPYAPNRFVKRDFGAGAGEFLSAYNGQMPAGRCGSSRLNVGYEAVVMTMMMDGCVMMVVMMMVVVIIMMTHSLSI